jgi:hypothetical protein
MFVCVCLGSIASFCHSPGVFAIQCRTELHGELLFYIESPGAQAFLHNFLGHPLPTTILYFISFNSSTPPLILLRVAFSQPFCGRTARRPCHHRSCAQRGPLMSRWCRCTQVSAGCPGDGRVRCSAHWRWWCHAGGPSQAPRHRPSSRRQYTVRDIHTVLSCSVRRSVIGSCVFRKHFFWPGSTKRREILSGSARPVRRQGGGGGSARPVPARHLKGGGGGGTF